MFWLIIFVTFADSQNSINAFEVYCEPWSECRINPSLLDGWDASAFFRGADGKAVGNMVPRNVMNFVDAVLRQGVAVYVGDVRENISSCMERLVFALEELLDNPQKRGEISVAMQKIVDGKGCKRLAEYLRML